MKKYIIGIITGLITLTGCNDKPEVQPVNYQVLQVYPNPATVMSNIRVGNQITQPYTLQVFDPNGKVILDERGNQGQQEYRIDLYEAKEGKYHVVLKAGNTITTQQLLKL